MDDFNHLEPDPLLEQGSFIDPNPIPSNGSNSEPVDPVAVETPSQVSVKKGGGAAASNGTKKSGKKTAAAAVVKSEPSEETVLPRPDWLPPDWEVTERVRNSGASKGSRDKYYKQLNSTHRFRSKKEVLTFLETGSTSKRKNTDDADNSPVPDSVTPKKKKSEAKAKVSLKNFKFDDPPEKVKWVLSDIYEATWRPLVNGVDRVPESAKQEWSAAFTHISLQNGNREAFI